MTNLRHINYNKEIGRAWQSPSNCESTGGGGGGGVGSPSNLMSCNLGWGHKHLQGGKWRAEGAAGYQASCLISL